MKKEYDVIVIGAGHAGLEAACAAARMQASVALITLNPNNIGEMSCNPAIGGLGKGHIVREIDALDGVMGRIIDKAGIQFKVLNQSKGPAVQGPRAQADRKLYKQQANAIVQEYKENYNLDVIFASVEDITTQNNVVTGVVLQSGENIQAKSVILTTGTFLSGVIHIGNVNYAGGRYGDAPSVGLADFLKRTGFDVSRLKTGTPARLNGKTIDFSKTTLQHGDEVLEPFSYLTTSITTKQIPCYITYTTQNTHNIIKDNIHLSAMYSGNISGVGPRYCPSIEDKVIRFAHKDQHQIFLEPEGLDDDTYYPNGISTSLPQHVQDAFIRSIAGLENVEITRYGYAIEYDYVNPTELKNTLETKKVANLFLAGQINGTTGYEEAGGQGLVAGINAVLNINNKPAFVLSRNVAYIGVMIDDLIHQGVTEPYRMFTSRAEYRMLLRADNADLRLSQLGYSIGVVSQHRYNVFSAKIKELNAIKQHMATLIATPNTFIKVGLLLNQDGIKRNALQWLSFNNISLQNIYLVWPQLQNYNCKLMDIVNIDCKYAFYIQRQQQEIEMFMQEENTVIPSFIDYKQINGLSNELVEKFNKVKPATLGAAMRITGATPSSAIAILAYLNKLKHSA